MAFAEIILLFYFAYMGRSSGKDCPPSPAAKRSLDRLRETLFCDYSREVRPVKNESESVSVSMDFRPLEISLGDDHLMRLEGLMEFIWTDSSLSWGPTEYEKILFLEVDNEIWLPDFSTNIMATTGVDHLRPSTCALDFLGEVACFPIVTFRSPCKMDLRLWPYDTQNCSITFSSYLHYERHVNLTSTQISIKSYRGAHDWELLSAKVDRERKTMFGEVYPIIRYTFSIRRQASAYGAATVFPAVAMLLVTLLTFFLGRNLAARVMICGFTMCGFSTELSYIMHVIPQNGDVVPVIIILLRDGLVLAAFATFNTVTVGILGNSESLPPQWISRAMDKLELSFVGRLLCLDTPAQSTCDDEEAILESSTKPNHWSSFNILLDRIAFISSLCVVLTLLMGYIP